MRSLPGDTAPHTSPIFSSPPGVPIPMSVSLQAAQWLVALQAENVQQETSEALRCWRAEHPDHERAWAHIKQFGAHLRELHSPLAHGVLASDEKMLKKRRQVVQLLALLAVTGGGALLIQDSTQGRELLADYKTGTGERNTIILNDGTELVLNARSAVNVRFDATQRLVSLIAGEILINTAPDPEAKRFGAARPFFVDTASGRLRALGTRFSVSHIDDAVQIGVFEGAVNIRPTDASDHTFVVQAGYQTRFTRDAIAPVDAVRPEAVAWTDGMLVAHEMPLADFIAAISRYRSGSLTCDPRVSDLKISGIYPLADSDRVLDMLQRTLPVDVHRITRYWVKLKPRAEQA